MNFRASHPKASLRHLIAGRLARVASPPQIAALRQLAERFNGFQRQMAATRKKDVELDAAREEFRKDPSPENAARVEGAVIPDQLHHERGQAVRALCKEQLQAIDREAKPIHAEIRAKILELIGKEAETLRAQELQTAARLGIVHEPSGSLLSLEEWLADADLAGRQIAANVQPPLIIAGLNFGDALLEKPMALAPIAPIAAPAAPRTTYDQRRQAKALELLAKFPDKGPEFRKALRAWTDDDDGLIH
ncbi:MAG TPA: hypothetical protein VGO11_19700 [Chthoniobacteraceae bacterium]|jgi:hypothetical protein|nr:hypothetical protein [Chthoniobacteraceae bacterium]